MLPTCGFVAQLKVARNWYLRGLGSNPINKPEFLNFFICYCLNCSPPARFTLNDSILMEIFSYFCLFKDKLYPHWNKRLREIWRTGYTRIYLFWIVLVVATAVVAAGIISDFVRWDTLNRDFVSTNELSRAFLASFILVMDLLIVMQVRQKTEERTEISQE